MQILERLGAGDPDTWNELYRGLYPVAFGAAKMRLGADLAELSEDVAIETLCEILQKSSEVKSEGELKPLTVAIARNKATDRLRLHLAEKRGGNKLQSLEAMLQSGGTEPGASPEDFLDTLTIQELRD